MDLDDLRRGLDEAATARPVDVPAAHRTVADRSRRRVRRRRTLASSAVVGTAITIVASVLALAGGPTGPSPSTVPGTAAPPAHPAYQPLPSRDGAALAYDAARRQAVLFGGFDNTHSLADTWLWDGHGWSEAHPSVSPPARDGATMAYDPASRTVLLFGGTYQPDTRVSTELDDTWSWDGKTWTDVSGAHRPPWSNGTAMSYDPASRSMILLTLPASHPNLDVTPNGVGSRGNTPFGTWRWTGRGWTELATPTAPLFAIGAVFHGDPRLAPLPDGKGLLFYSWAVFTGSCPAIVVNGHARSACDNGPDPAGTRDSQTYTWDGSRWTKQLPARAPGSADVLVAPGAAPRIFGSGTTWAWNGSTWAPQHTHDTPDALAGAIAVYDNAHDEIVAYAGALGTDGGEFDTWTWNGSWTRRATGVPVTTTTTSTTPTTRAPTTTTAATGAPACTTAQLKLSLARDLGSLMEQPGAYFALTNMSSNACTLAGYPTLSLYTASRQIIDMIERHGDSYQINDPGVHPIVVQPRQSAYFGFGWTDVNYPDGGTETGCVSVVSVAVIVPGTQLPLNASAPLGELFCPPGGTVTAIAPRSAFTPSSP